jgi:hypothetical protein
MITATTITTGRATQKFVNPLSAATWEPLPNSPTPSATRLDCVDVSSAAV